MLLLSGRAFRHTSKTAVDTVTSGGKHLDSPSRLTTGPPLMACRQSAGRDSGSAEMAGNEVAQNCAAFMYSGGLLQ